jgi:hypothetical protein
MSANNIDGIWPYDKLVGGQRALPATTMALTNRVSVTAQSLRCQRALGLAALASGLHLLRSARYVALVPFQNVPTIIRTIIARAERGFADFAQIPYQDALAQQELSRLLDEFGAEWHTEQFD